MTANAERGAAGPRCRRNTEESVHFGPGDIFDRWRRWPSRRESSSGAVVMPPTPPRHSAAGVCRAEAANDNYIIAYVEKGEKKPSGTNIVSHAKKIIIISISISIVRGRARCIDSGRRVPFAVCTPARNHIHTHTHTHTYNMHTYINIRSHALTHAHTHTHAIAAARAATATRRGTSTASRHHCHRRRRRGRSCSVFNEIRARLVRRFGCACVCVCGVCVRVYVYII